MPKIAKSHFDRIKIAMTTDFKCSKTVIVEAKRWIQIIQAITLVTTHRMAEVLSKALVK